jgi:hypothetical protein
VAAVDGAVIQEALQLPLADLGDAVTAASARLAGCECIVTRDPRGFRGCPVRALTPEAVMPLLTNNDPERPEPPRKTTVKAAEAEWRRQVRRMMKELERFAASLPPQGDSAPLIRADCER